ncbi:hypothetical protein J3R30DRAFT_3724440 [Lentinula aciculospora]|uniref:Uncharacterized protein n=1 Tax=Lentinula aciculospora TaxID=153920 RepID=A0A9W8ZRU5_9AGAR|nr:hypothetical protein J3R30DRAFT_3724440 [Lentinula aciculospora]
MSGTSSLMPRPGSRDAPKLTAEGTEDPMKRKKWTVRYPEEQVAWEWKAMNEYSSATSTFSDFKTSVLRSYPGATDEERGTMRELNRLFKKYKNIASDDLDEYMALIRKFRAVKKELNPLTVAGAAVQVEPLVTNRELVEKFTRALDLGFRNAIYAALYVKDDVFVSSGQPIVNTLHIKGKTRSVPAGQKVRPDDMYDIDEVVAQGEAIARGTMPGTDPMSSVNPSASTSHNTSSSQIKQEHFQQQIQDLISEKIEVLLDTVKISQDQLRQENAKQMNDLMRIYQQSNVTRTGPAGYAPQQSSAGFEHNPNAKSQNADVRETNKVPYDWHNNLSSKDFCSEEGHVANECHHRQDLLEMGRIVLVNGRARLPGNYPIPIQPVGAVSEKDRIDFYYAEKERKEKEGMKSVNLVQSTPHNIPGMINTATMTTFLNNQLSEKEIRIANLEKELQSLSNPSSQMLYQGPSQMNQFVQQPYSIPQYNPMMQSQFSQVGWNPDGQMNNFVPSPNSTMQMLNSMYQNQNTMSSGYNNMPMAMQSNPTMAEAPTQNPSGKVVNKPSENSWIKTTKVDETQNWRKKTRENHKNIEFDAEEIPENPFINVKDVSELPMKGAANMAKGVHNTPVQHLSGQQQKDMSDSGPAYKFIAPIQKLGKVEEVVDRILDSQISIKAGELLSTSKPIREELKHRVTQQRIATSEGPKLTQVEDQFEGLKTPNCNTIDVQSLPSVTWEKKTERTNNGEQVSAFVVGDVVLQYLETLAPDEIPKQVVVAKSSQGLRSIYPLINGRVHVESLLDSGSQIVSTSQQKAEEAGLIWDPDIVIYMQSANRGLEKSLGLARNVPFLIGDLTVLLQVHVIREPAYDLLLGRPIDTLLQTYIQNFADGRQVITLTDPTTNRRITVPTFSKGFSNNLKDLIQKDQGEVAIIFEVDECGEVKIDKYCLPDKRKFTSDGLQNAYLVASLDATPHDRAAQKTLSSYLSSVYSGPSTTPLGVQVEVPQFHPVNFVKLLDMRKAKSPTRTPKTFENSDMILKTSEKWTDQISKTVSNFYFHYTPLSSFIFKLSESELNDLYPSEAAVDFEPVSVLAARKYKPVAKKVKPIIGELPQKFRIIREITGDPLKDMPKLSTHPPEFTPTGRYTLERKEIIDKIHSEDFLWPEERKLMHHLMMEQEKGFAWNDEERGKFREDFFPPVDMPVIPHTPWVEKNIPIPPGTYHEVCKAVKVKIDAGVYEPSHSSYRSRWFGVLKKDGKSIRLVHSLEPLNKVTIQHSGLPPATDELADQFAGYCQRSMSTHKTTSS